MEKLKGSGEPLSFIRAGEASGDFPLAHQQQGLWFLSTLNPHAATWNIFHSARLEGHLNYDAFRSAYEEVHRRHAVLRTTIRMIGDEPRQCVAADPVTLLHLTDLSSESEAVRETRARLLAEEESLNPLDLSSAPLIRGRLVKLTSVSHILMLTVHHIIADARSVQILVEELGALYCRYSGKGNEEPALPTVQYHDYAVWQLRVFDEAHLAPQRAYWLEELKGGPRLLRLRQDFRPAPGRKARARWCALRIGPEKTSQLKAASFRLRLPLSATMLMAYSIVLNRLTGDDQVHIGAVFSIREAHRQLENLIGYFANTVVVRLDFADCPTVSDLTAQVRTKYMGAYRNSAYPFDRVVRDNNPKRDTSTSPLYRVMFSMAKRQTQDVAFGGLRYDDEAYMECTEPQADVLLNVLEGPEDLTLVAEYDASLFEEQTLVRLLHYMDGVLDRILEGPERELSRLTLTPPPDEQGLVASWNKTRLEYPRDTVLHGLFEAQAARTPAAVAVQSSTAARTYSELDRGANRLARHLRMLGIGKGHFVGIHLERGVQMVVSLLAVLKCGAAYVPLDPAYPPERLAFIVKDSGISVLLTDRTRAGGAPWHTGVTVCLDAEEDRIALHDPEPISCDVSQEDLAYLIYTSGSTGIPKGVAIEHGNAVALMYWARNQYDDATLSGVLASTSICFDLSVFELFAPLSWGGRVLLAENMLDLAQLPAAGEVTLVNTVPSVMVEYIGAYELPQSIRVVNLAGEPLHNSLVARLYQNGNVRKVFDLYGPSECTTYSTCGLRTPDGPETIGRPIANTQVYILDEALEPVPVGVPGEIHIGGGGVARGYLNRPELTAERFLRDRFSPDAEARLYKTGDYACYLADGNIQFLGRKDGQVKIRGFRIELGEIEEAIREDGGVAEAVVLSHERPGRPSGLVAYVVPKEGRSPDPSQLRENLLHKVPNYMLPSSWVFLPSMPLTPNGKVDYKALHVLEVNRPELTVPHAGPRCLVEEMLCDIWGQVLSLQRVGIYDSFFELGGHSLLAVRVTSRIRDALGVDVPVSAIFRHPTIAELAREVNTLRRESRGVKCAPIQPAPARETGPLARAELTYYNLARLAPQLSLGNMTFPLRLKGALNVEALERSFAEILRRHQVLLSAFEIREGVPRRRICSASFPDLVSVDLRHLREDERELEVLEQFRTIDQMRFDLNRGAVPRLRLLRLHDDEYALLVCVHHSVFDDWSWSILFMELAQLYTAFVGGQASPLPPLPCQFADYAVWQERQLGADGALTAQIDYWRGKLAGPLQELRLPYRVPEEEAQRITRARATKVQDYLLRLDRAYRQEADFPQMTDDDFLLFQTQAEPLEIPESTYRALQALALERHVTLFMVLVAAFGALLWRFSGNTDVRIGAPVAGRVRRPTELLLGNFANSLTLRLDLSGEPRFSELLSQVRQTSLEAYDHQEVPEEVLDEALDRRGESIPFLSLLNVATMPQYSHVFRLPGLEISGWPLKRERVQRPNAEVKELRVKLFEDSKGLHGEMVFSMHLFDTATARRIRDYYQYLLAALETNSGRTLNEVCDLVDDTAMAQ